MGLVKFTVEVAAVAEQGVEVLSAVEARRSTASRHGRKLGGVHAGAGVVSDPARITRVETVMDRQRGVGGGRPTTRVRVFDDGIEGTGPAPTLSVPPWLIVS